MKRVVVFLLAFLLTASAATVSASACASIYIGAALTEDGSALVARSEDLSANIDKLFFFREAGTHKAGEELHGCYGFSWTFTHDSYAYTAFPDDNGSGVGGVCPDCGSTEENHAPYEEAGTNEKGLTVSATETLYSARAISAVDPLVGDGISESEMTTVLLAECAGAREAVELLLSIYETAGAQDANGLFIADQEEIWYIENLSGHQYIALLLPDDLAFIETNLSVIGAIDLNDTDHVLASDGLIETALAAGTFTGDADRSIIDFRVSYSDAAESGGYGSRLINGLNYLRGEEIYTEETAEDKDFVISNVDEAGNLVPLYTNITLTHPFSVDDVVSFYKVSPIGRPANQETHIFQILPDEEPALGTVEWVSMANDLYTVFVPHYPMLISDTYEGYQVSTAKAAFSSDEPDAGRDWISDTQFNWGSSSEIEGFRVLPENWRSSCYWAFDAVSALITSGSVTAEEEERVVSGFASLQQSLYDRFAAQREALAGLSVGEASALATDDSAQMARDAHFLALALYDELTAK